MERQAHLYYPQAKPATKRGLEDYRNEGKNSSGRRDTLTITRHRDVCEYIKNEEVNSRQNMTFAEETIQFEKASEPYAQLFENFCKCGA
ncbi:MAG: hypothetical protein ACLUZ6_04980 [Lachnospira eligens]